MENHLEYWEELFCRAYHRTDKDEQHVKDLTNNIRTWIDERKNLEGQFQESTRKFLGELKPMQLQDQIWESKRKSLIVNHIWTSLELQHWLEPARRGKTERILLVTGEIGYALDYGYGTRITKASYALAELVKFLDEAGCLILRYTISLYQNKWENDWENKGLDVLASLIAQLVTQTARKRRRVDLPGFADIMRYLYQENVARLMELFYKILDLLPKKETVYIIMDFNNFAGPHDAIQAIMELTNRPGVLVKVLIADIDLQKDLKLASNIGHETISVDSSEGKSDEIDLEGEVYKIWRAAVSRGTVST